MKYKWIIGLVCIHLLIVAIRSFNNIVPQKQIIHSKVVNTFLNTYTQYTVMQADYAFFSPDIGSSPFVKILVTAAADSFYVPFNAGKGEFDIRLFTSLNAFNNAAEARELMARSWSAYVLKEHPEADKIMVSYFIKVPPTYHQYAKGKRTVDSLLFEVKYQVNAE